MKHTIKPDATTGLKVMLLGALAGTMSWGNSSLKPQGEIQSLSLASETVTSSPGAAPVLQVVDNSGQLLETSHKVCNQKIQFQVNWRYIPASSRLDAEAVRILSDGTKVTINRSFENKANTVLKQPQEVIRQMDQVLTAAVAEEAACKPAASAQARPADANPTAAASAETRVATAPVQDAEAKKREEARLKRERERVAKCEIPEGRRSWGSSTEALEAKGECLVGRLENLDEEIEAELLASQRPGSRDREVSETAFASRLRSRHASIIAEIRDIARRLYTASLGEGSAVADGLIDSAREDVAARFDTASDRDGKVQYGRLLRSLDAVKEAAHAIKMADSAREEGDALLSNLMEAKASGDNAWILRSAYDWNRFQQLHGAAANHAQSSLRQARAAGLLTQPEVSDFSASWAQLADMIRTGRPSDRLVPPSLRTPMTPEQSSALIAARANFGLPNGVQAPNRNQLNGLFASLLPPEFAGRAGLSSGSNLGVPNLGGTQLSASLGVPGTGSIGGLNNRVSTL